MRSRGYENRGSIFTIENISRRWARLTDDAAFVGELKTLCRNHHETSMSENNRYGTMRVLSCELKSKETFLRSDGVFDAARVARKFLRNSSLCVTVK